MSAQPNDLSRYTSLFAAQNIYKNEWEKNERLYNNRFADEEWKRLKKKRRSRIFIPTIQNTVDIIESIFSTAFFSAGCPIEILGNDPEEVRRLNLIVKEYYDKLKPQSELVKAFRSALLFRVGITATYWDNQKNRVITRQIPVTDLAFDDEAVNLEDIEDFAYTSTESVRKIKNKIKNKIYNQSGLSSKLNLDDENTKRYERKHYYSLTQRGKLLEKIYIKNVLVHKQILKKNPFQYGFAISELASVDKSKRENQILAYGGNFINKVENLAKELNQKRNLKNDLQEKILNPDVFLGDDAKVDPRDLTFGHGKGIRVKGKLSEIKERQVPGEYSLTQDTQLIRNDLRESSGVNSMLEGHTGASDRRSQKALATINSNSSMRIQQMISLMNETLFEHWAKTWVYLVLKNADDAVINKITGVELPFGPKGNRKNLEYSIKINFGTTIEKEASISDLINVIQMLAPDQRINPKVKDYIVKKFLNLRLGDDINLNNLFTEEIPTQEEEQTDNTPQKTNSVAML